MECRVIFHLGVERTEEEPTFFVVLRLLHFDLLDTAFRCFRFFTFRRDLLRSWILSRLWS